MNETDAIHHWRTQLETQFPKVCGNCKRSYADLHDYLRHTQPLGPVVSYDVDDGEWWPSHPVRIMTFAICTCHNTLVLASTGMLLNLLYEILLWARIETLKRGVTPSVLLTELRERMCQEILSAPEPHSAAPAAPQATAAPPAPAS